VSDYFLLAQKVITPGGEKNFDLETIGVMAARCQIVD
jgi:hypothetical protein